jgi:hypothetical protein
MSNKFNPFDMNINVRDSHYNNLRKRFFDSIGQNHIMCYNNNPRVKLSGMNHANIIDEVLDANITKNSDAYFYVNGSRKKDDIRSVRCCYIDLDAGRDANGQYFRPKQVLESKAVFMKMIQGFKVPPSWIVDTRNGYQVYWVLSENDHKLGLTTNKKYWNGIQKKLANYFHADIRAMKINQIFRIPFTWWRKPWEGKKSYFSTLVDGYNGHKVSIVNLQEALTGQSAQISVKSANSSDAWYESWRQVSNDPNAVPISKDTAHQILNKLIKQDAAGVAVLEENDDIPDYIEEVENNDTNNIINNGVQFVPSDAQLKLLSSVVDFLNQAATPLFFSNNKFLSASARELAVKLSDQFCVG